MGIDKFINDYLDGIISPEDDQKFRNLLEEDPKAREEFELMLNLHSLLKDDANSVEVPNDLKQRTEERIYAHYLSLYKPKPTYWRENRLVAVLASVVLLFLLLTNRIDEGRLVKNNLLFLNELSKQEEILRASVPQFDEELISYESSGKIQKFPSNTSFERNLTGTSNQMQNVPILTFSNVDRVAETFVHFSNNISSFEEFILPNAEDGKYLNPKLETYSVSYSPLHLNLDLLNNVSTFRTHGNEFRFIPSELSLYGMLMNGFISSPILKLGFGNAKIRNFSDFSQSFGYRFGENFRLGLEFGYFSFSFDERTTILVPGILSSKTTPNSISESKESDATLSKGSDNQNGHFIQIPVQIQQDYQLYWGSLYIEYEHSINKYLNLIGRGNFGTTNEGPFTRLILYSEVKPISGLAINFGIENKSFWIKGRNSIPGAFKSVFGIVYGLSFKLNFED
ncbi:MAG: hypothetical protein N2517_08435 [Ignavibacteria bacterium]|nr:hypothetical protein [Ignavibacteria bacterium]